MTSQKALRMAREALKQGLPTGTSQHGATPDPRFLHVPASHIKALHPDVMLVVGMRGAGKTFWWATLQNQANRQLLEKLAPRAVVSATVDVAAGFGERPDPDAYPSRDVLAKLLSEGIEPRLIWKSIVAYHLAGSGDCIRTLEHWTQRAPYVRDEPEEVDRLLARRDQELEGQKRWWLILFDALDRSATDWKEMHALIRGLLQTALDLRPYRRIRLKCFLRTDQLDESAVADFPDASKVLSSRVQLSWPAHELYGLVWRHLGNAPDPAGSDFRAETQRALGEDWQSVKVRAEKGEISVWLPSPSLLSDSERQRAMFHLITGPWMGRDRRRGFPYTWVPSHLADAQGRTSPRSFLAALRTAAEDTVDRYPDHDWPLHYESIKRGVQSASRIRVQELQEDYPWIQTLMEPLRGSVVPCEFEHIDRAWRQHDVLDGLRQRVAQDQVRLPPEHLDRDADGVRSDLEALGIFLRLRDGRVNVPDVFRVGYGLGRRGGVRPVQRGEQR